MTTNLLTPPARLWTLDDLGIRDAATRRQFIAMLGAAGLLAACGDDGGGGNQSGSKAETRTVFQGSAPPRCPSTRIGSSPCTRRTSTRS